MTINRQTRPKTWTQTIVLPMSWGGTDKGYIYFNNLKLVEIGLKTCKGRD